MTVKEHLSFIKNEIHSTVMATVDENGLPQTCVIDIMLAKDESLYFLTAKGKKFYERLMDKKYVALSGMKGKNPRREGNDTMSTVAVSVRGYVRHIGSDLLDKIFEENSYMAEIYKTEESKAALEVFEIYEGEGEYFDLSQKPPYREAFSFGGGTVNQAGYYITNDCIGCGACTDKCPTNCIDSGMPFMIRQENCLHCGNCYEICPAGAVEKR